MPLAHRPVSELRKRSSKLRINFLPVIFICGFYYFSLLLLLCF